MLNHLFGWSFNDVGWIAEVRWVCTFKYIIASNITIVATEKYIYFDFDFDIKGCTYQMTFKVNIKVIHIQWEFSADHDA